MHIAQLGIRDALSRLHGSAGGLGSAEALRRRGEFGANRIERIRGEPSGLQFARQFVHFFALVPILLPLSIAQILAVDLGTAALPAAGARR